MRARSFVPHLLACLVVPWLVPSSAAAHGLFGHVHVTGYAIENLPPGELRDLLSDPAVFDAALMGATFPDTGYALGDATTRDYGETAHWEPFIQDMIEHVRTTYGPTYDTLEERKLIAFVLGMAAHGMQDELFDSTFDHEAVEHDGPAEYDTIIDGFFAYDLHARMLPSGTYVPFDDLLQVYASNGKTFTQALIQRQIDIVLGAYVNDGLGLNTAIAFGENNIALLPWTYAHYLDPAVPGSFRAEITPTAAYMQAIWDRLNDRYAEDDLVIHAWPDAPRRLRSSDHTSVMSYVTLVFGVGVDYSTVRASLVDDAGQPHPFQLVNTRWNAQVTRVVQLRATADYVPGAHYVARIEDGILRIDGASSTAAHDVPFQVECTAPDAAVCPDLGPLDDPTIDGPQPPTVPPTGTMRGGGCSAAPKADGDAPLVGILVVAAAWLRARTRRRPAATESGDASRGALP